MSSFGYKREYLNATPRSTLLAADPETFILCTAKHCKVGTAEDFRSYPACGCVALVTIQFFGGAFQFCSA
jgi:hypothetical protein